MEYNIQEEDQIVQYFESAQSATKADHPSYLPRSDGRVRDDSISSSASTLECSVSTSGAISNSPMSQLSSIADDLDNQDVVTHRRSTMDTELISDEEEEDSFLEDGVQAGVNMDDNDEDMASSTKFQVQVVKMSDSYASSDYSCDSSDGEDSQLSTNGHLSMRVASENASSSKRAKVKISRFAQVYYTYDKKEYDRSAVGLSEMSEDDWENWDFDRRIMRADYQSWKMLNEVELEIQRSLSPPAFEV
ncbi:hypothetical protein MP228_012250 [Amoeboaphelidium protococcarum]|nr:hypothetical protein MP228_012250 [Amoeboaphelidium protococcarum]